MQPPHYVHCVQAQFHDGKTDWIGPFANDDESGSYAAQMNTNGLCFQAYRNVIITNEPVGTAAALTSPKSYPVAPLERSEDATGTA
jgi:hypothetical protein